MPHISSRRLKEEEEQVLKSRLVDVFRIIGKDRKVSYSIKEFLTDTEMIMLAKRLGIIYLVDRGMSTLEICETLKMSSSTVIRVEKRMDRGGYQNLRKALKKLEPSCVDIIETILGAGMPPIVGRGRWKFLDNY